MWLGTWDLWDLWNLLIYLVYLVYLTYQLLLWGGDGYIKSLVSRCYIVEYRVLLWTGKWAKYIDKDVESQVSFIKKALKCLFNRLTPLYSEIYYEEENYLKVRTKLLIYLSPPPSKGRYVRYVRYIKYVYRSYRSHRSHVSDYMTWLPLVT